MPWSYMAFRLLKRFDSNKCLIKQAIRCHRLFNSPIKFKQEVFTIQRRVKHEVAVSIDIFILPKPFEVSKVFIHQSFK